MKIEVSTSESEEKQNHIVDEFLPTEAMRIGDFF
jgi:hypothetical protein